MKKSNYPKLIKNTIVFILLMAIHSLGLAQTTIVKGAVIDAESKLPVPFASVYFKEGKGVTADSSGRFEISTEGPMANTTLLFRWTIKKWQV